MVDDQVIKEYVEGLHRQIWRSRDALWPGRKPNPIEMLSPEVAAQVLGISIAYLESLGQYRDAKGSYEVAGFFDRLNSQIALSASYPEEVIRFTAAHEIAHCVMHDDLILHRDCPLDGNSLSPDLKEVEANRFASFFLMPEKLVRNEFEKTFGKSPLNLNENFAFWLGMDLQALNSCTKEPLKIEKTLAGASFFGGKPINSLAKRFKVSETTMAIRLRELGLINGVLREAGKRKPPKWASRAIHFGVEGKLMPVTNSLLKENGHASKTRLLVMQHALRDSAEFVESLRESGVAIDIFVAKPNSVDQKAISRIKNCGVEVVTEPEGTPRPYDYYEGTSVLYDLIVQECRAARSEGRKLVIVDVGGYFCAPLARISREMKDHIAGVVEVTTFGHRRYSHAASNLTVPIYSIARSPLKEAEANYVGDSVIRATEDLFQSAGQGLSGKVCGVVGFGMIGSKIARTLQDRKIRALVTDSSSTVMLQARLAGFEVRYKSELLAEADVVFSATGSRAIELPDVMSAKGGVTLISGGSRANEFDVSGIRRFATHSTEVVPGLTRHEFPAGKACFIANNGKAVNFLKDGTPEEYMDIVFAEISSAISLLLEESAEPGKIWEVSDHIRDNISDRWLGLRPKGVFPSN